MDESKEKEVDETHIYGEESQEKNNTGWSEKDKSFPKLFDEKKEKVDNDDNEETILSTKSKDKSSKEREDEETDFPKPRSKDEHKEDIGQSREKIQDGSKEEDQDRAQNYKIKDRSFHQLHNGHKEMIKGNYFSSWKQDQEKISQQRWDKDNKDSPSSFAYEVPRSMKDKGTNFFSEGGGVKNYKG